MSDRAYLTAPDPTLKGWPRGIKYIIGNEACERFSFYGMKAILMVHLTMLFTMTGLAEEAAGREAQHMIHLFIAAAYALPMLGALVADRLLGKYNVILWLSIVYCAGHGVLALGGEDSVGGMMLGLGLIALGAGGIKPCVSAHVGDQFGKENWHLIKKVFQLFYFSINFGSLGATLLIPVLYKHFGASVAFGLPGALMAIATLFFWMGRHDFVHVPAKPAGKLGLLDALSSTMLFLGFIGLPMFFVEILGGWGTTLAAMVIVNILGILLFLYRQKLEQDDGFLAVSLASVMGKLDKFSADSIEATKAVLRVFSVFIMVSVFWALFDQHSSSWIRQGTMMDLNFIGLKLLPSQIQSLNPAMVMLLIPLNMFVIYPVMDKFFDLSPIRKMTIGMFMASLSFVAVAFIQRAITAGAPQSVSVAWQFIPFVLITQAEVMVSITGLEFAYTQAPARMKSTIMGFWMLTVALGNKLVAIITMMPDMGLEKFFWTFAALMAGAALIFAVRGSFYVQRDYTQDHSA